MNETWEVRNTRQTWNGRERTVTCASWEGPNARENAERHAAQCAENTQRPDEDGTWTVHPA